MFTFPLHYIEMKIDKAWFLERIAATPQGSVRQLAPLIQTKDGPMDHTKLSKILNGVRSIQIEEVRSIASALGVSPIDVLIRSGCLKASDLRNWKG